MINYQLWDKKNERYLFKSECWNIGIRMDGRIIEFCPASGGDGDIWLDEIDVSDEYDIHINTYEELLK